MDAPSSSIMSSVAELASNIANNSFKYCKSMFFFSGDNEKACH
jgi:hypothetical protein